MTDYLSPLVAIYALLLGADLLVRARSPTLLHTLRPSPPGAGKNPKVSIIVPARNAERTVRGCVTSLLSLDYSPKEVIFVEGGSSDRTREILASFGPEITLVDEGPLPPGWVGKSWACHRGYLAADGDYLLFTDSDTLHSPWSLAAAVSYARAEGIGMLSLSPRTLMRTAWERVILPVAFMVFNDLARRRRVNVDTSKYAWGIGTYLLLRKEDYAKFGGHEAARDKIDEDVWLATLARKNGIKVRLADGSACLSTSMYDSLPSMFEGLTRNFYGMARRSWSEVWYALGATLFRFFLPFAVLGLGVAGLLNGQWWPISILSPFVAALAYAGAISFASKLGSGTAYALLLPLSSLVLIVILLDAMLRAGSGIGVSWKERRYVGD